MTLTKNKMVSEIGRRTRLKNQDVQTMLEGLIEVWTEELVNGGRIELENFVVLEVQIIDRGDQVGTLITSSGSNEAPRIIRCLTIRGSKHLKRLLNNDAKEYR
ncbi:MAG: HU family DNA-binding protein [Anaerolineae bacterium]|nr:HU family DNA-binding protein [Anaerolineae bacterium]